MQVNSTARKYRVGLKSITAYVVKVLIFISLVLSAIWLGFVLWFHFSSYPIIQWLAMGAVLSLSSVASVGYLYRHAYVMRVLASYAALFWAVGGWFVMLPAKHDRAWQPQVDKSLRVIRSDSNPDIVTLNNVRDFRWQRTDGVDVAVTTATPHYERLAESDAVVVSKKRWVNRTIDMSKLSGVDVINSYWMGKKIAHTLVSFRFSEGRPLTFSLEIRKEQGESFSALGGFFRQFELSLIAAEERDIVYTRSNIRGEAVYLFPITGVTHDEIRGLFLSYLRKAESLQQQPQWYNTLTSNCTNIVFEMARQVSGNRLPIDYRIWMSGYLPNYLFDMGFLVKNVQGMSSSKDDKLSLENWTIEDWYKQAYINPKAADFTLGDNQDSYSFTQKIREGLPMPTLSPEVNKLEISLKGTA